VGFALQGCDAQSQYEKELYDATYKSEYAKTVNKLEMVEGNFESWRRVTFYNVRLGETVFSCEGYCHVKVDRDGDIELVVKTGDNEYLRHYLGQKQDITYFSEQIEASKVPNNKKYSIIFNPKLWLPSFEGQDDPKYTPRPTQDTAK